VLVALALVATGAAIAKRKPAYFGKHHTRVTHGTAWALSYMGSSTWNVQETVTNPQGQETWNEGSEEQWHFDVPNEQAQAATFSVAYPTTCLEFRGIRCPSRQGAGASKGPSTIGYHIHDTDPPGTVDCSGRRTSHAGGTAVVEATYIKDTDSYKLKIDNDPLVPGLAETGFSDPQCPGPNTNGVDVLEIWTPPDLPSGGPLLSDWWSAASVTIPAREFATYSAIDIPVSARHGVPKNCGIPAGSGGVTVTCSVHGSWSGTLVLHRIAGG
jgi:hypothetical protein